MEALAVAASVVSLVAFTLDIVHELHPLASKYKSDVAEEFIKEVNVSKDTLEQAQQLAMRVEGLNLQNSARLPLSSLNIQVQEWSNDFKGCRDHARSLVENEAKRKGTSTRSRNLINALLRIREPSTALGHPKKTSKVVENLRQHRFNIAITVNLLGREIDLHQITVLHGLKSDLEGLDNTATDQTKLILNEIESLSNSNSSVLAHSRSAEQRLGEVKAGTDSVLEEIRQLKSLFLNYVSSESSRDTSTDQVSHIVSAGSATSSRGRETSDRAFEQERLGKLASNRKDTESSDLAPKANSHISAPNYTKEPEFERLMKASEFLINIVASMYTPLMSEYIATVGLVMLLTKIQAITKSKILQTQAQIKPGMIYRRQRRIQRRLERLIRHTLSLRKICVHENLLEQIKEVEHLFDVKEETILGWTKHAESHSLGDKLHEKIILKFPTGNEKEERESNILRINAWLFDVADSHPHLVDLHQKFHQEWCDPLWFSGKKDPKIQDLTKKALEKQAADRQTSITRSLQLETRSIGDWKTVMLRFWFLDGTMLPNTEYARSVTAETDATVIIEEQMTVGRLYSGLDDDLSTEVLIRQPECPSLADIPLESLILGLNEPPALCLESDIEKADAALQAFRLETVK